MTTIPAIISKSIVQMCRLTLKFSRILLVIIHYDKFDTFYLVETHVLTDFALISPNLRSKNGNAERRLNLRTMNFEEMSKQLAEI